MTIAERYMLRALKMARLGGRDVAPNPMVGCVIVKNGKIIGQGYHKKFGGPHAEVNAIHSVRHKSDLIGATMYVTLEPCRHWGKTPPCLGLIQRVSISCVICGSHDPFRQNVQCPMSNVQTNPNIQFLNGPVADECRELNKFFFTWITKKRPYITAKIAISADGFVAGVGGKPVRITNHQQDIEVHKLRAAHQAIMVGANTVLSDDPHLGVRYVKGKDPLRIILNSNHRLPRKAKVFRDKNFMVVTGAHGKSVNLKKLFVRLAKQGISSVLVEPGPTLYHSLKKARLIDELVVFTGKRKIGRGLKANI